MPRIYLPVKWSCTVGNNTDLDHLHRCIDPLCLADERLVRVREQRVRRQAVERVGEEAADVAFGPFFSFAQDFTSRKKRASREYRPQPRACTPHGTVAPAPGRFRKTRPYHRLKPVPPTAAKSLITDGTDLGLARMNDVYACFSTLLCGLGAYISSVRAWDRLQSRFFFGLSDLFCAIRPCQPEI